MSKIVTIKNLTISFSHQPLFQEANLLVETGERVALVGRNGTGKSTLLKAIAGIVEPDAGTIETKKGAVISLLSQSVPVSLAGSVFDVVAGGLSSSSALLKRYYALLEKISSSSDEQLLIEQAHLSAEIELENGWIYHQRIETILSKLSLNGHDQVESLSGGLKRRVLLARALVNEPDVLLLDEPTNHLDVDAVVWLEDFFKKYNKTLIFITHDRSFLSSIATRIIEIDYRNIFSWPGDYKNYQRLKLDLIQAQAKEQALFAKKLSQEEAWIREGIKARRTRNEGRVRRLEALRLEKTQQFKVQGRANFQIESEAVSGKLVFHANEISFSYGETCIIKNFSTIVARGDRVGIVGPNGSGKSTLIKLLLGKLLPTSGFVRQGTNLKVAYFDQYRFEINDDQTAVDNVGQGREFITINNKQKHVISYLQDFLFSPERARQKVSVFSGGEKNRLLLAKLFSQPANLIVMDEPTNDLDIETLELLEERLSEFTGTLLIVSHDRAFLDNVTTQLWVMEEDGHIQEFIGGYSQWIENKTNVEQTSQTVIKKSTEPTHSNEKATHHKWTHKEKKELAALPAKITKIEDQLSLLQEKILEKDFYLQDPDKIKSHSEQISSLELELEQCYERWQLLEDLKG